MSKEVGVLSNRFQKVPRDNLTDIEVSIVIPCLNEIDAVATCVRKAVPWLSARAIRGEVILSDQNPVFLPRTRAVHEDEAATRRLREALARKTEVSAALTRLSAERQKRFKEKQKPRPVFLTEAALFGCIDGNNVVNAR